MRSTFPDYDPANYDHRYLGPVRMREALANSLNVPAVVVLSKIGPRNAWNYLERCGIKFGRTFSACGTGFILGNADVRLIDLTAAYSAFARDGLVLEPQLIAATPMRQHAIASPEAAWILVDVLSDNRAREKTFGSSSPLAFANGSIPVKTGTSSGFRDGWAVGCTKEHTVGVWAGRYDGHGMGRTAAIVAAAPLWRKAIDELLAKGDTGMPGIGKRSTLVRRSVCSTTGLLAGNCSPEQLMEVFLPGTQPIETADSMFVIRDGKPVLVLPSMYAVWCESDSNHIGAEVDRRSPLTIVNPRDEAKFIFDKQLPAHMQRIALTAVSGNGSPVRWEVDSHPVPISNGLHLWRLEAGEHVGTAFGSDGTEARVRFNVE